MVIRAVHRLPLRDVLSCGDGPQAACVATRFNEELSHAVAMNSTFPYAFDAIHVHDRSCTRKEYHSTDALSRASQARHMTEVELLLTDEVRAREIWLWVRYLQQRSTC